MTYEDIAIGAVTYLVGIALYAIWDLQEENIENVRVIHKLVDGEMPSWIEEIKKVKLKMYQSEELRRLAEIIRSNSTTRHAIQRRDKRGRFV